MKKKNYIENKKDEKDLPFKYFLLNYRSLCKKRFFLLPRNDFHYQHRISNSVYSVSALKICPQYFHQFRVRLENVLNYSKEISAFDSKWFFCLFFLIAGLILGRL
jgi:hypothetical protein